VADSISIPAGILGGVAGRIDSAEALSGIAAVGGKLDDTNADPEAERRPTPVEAEVGNRSAQLFGNGNGRTHRTLLHQHAELVTADPSKAVPCAQLGSDQRRYLLPKSVARGMSTGVVDNPGLVGR